MEKYDKVTDEQLIRDFRNGDREIMDHLMMKYKAMVRKKARAMYLFGGENEDLIQEGMIGLFKAIRDYRPEKESSFYHFAELCISRQMYTAVQASGRKKHMPLNTYISLSGETTHTDEQKENVPLENVLQSGQLSDPEKMLIDRENVEYIEQMIQSRLSSFEKQVLDLYLTGMGYVEIAKVLGRDEKSTDNALSRLKSKLRKVIE